MLTILLDGKPAVLKANSNFELVAENSRFEKSDSYTLDISFPLKDCPQNLEIFGMMYRKDVHPEKLIFRCDIVDHHIQRSGSAIVIEFSDSEVKCQFLEGRSGASLTSPVADVYINEIKITAPETDKSKITPREAWARELDCVALPWVNNDSGIMQNHTIYDAAQKKMLWHDDCRGLSWLPYLTTVIKGICKAIGYSVNLSAFEADPKLKWLLVCNALPFAWDTPEVAAALPHWTVEEFFSNLEDFLYGEFSINHMAKSITFRSAEEIYSESKVVEISKDINDFTAEVFVKDSDCKAIEISNVKYKECSHQMQKWYDCNWIINMWRNKGKVMEFDTLTDLMEAHKNNFQLRPDGHRNNARQCIYYIKDEDVYYCTRTIYRDPENSKKMKLDLQQINSFGARIVNDSDDAREVELKFVPACIDVTDMDYGWTLFNSPGSVYGDADAAAETEEGNKRGSLEDPANMIINGEPNSKSEEFYDCIYLGWWDGNKQFGGQTNPFPNVFSTLHIWNPIDTKKIGCSFSLDNEESNFVKFSNKIDPSIKYNIKFLADSLPDPKAVYLIKGKKYICEKLTASMTVKGMSQLVKGVFWAVKS